MLNIRQTVAFSLLIPVLASCATQKAINPNALIKLPEKTIVKDNNIHSTDKSKDLFIKEQTNLELSFIHQTPTPIWIPPVVSKVLIMPYVDANNNLHSYQYAYIELQKGKWLIGNYLSTKQENNKIIEPLDTSSKQLHHTRQPLSDMQSNYNSKSAVNETASHPKKGYFQGGSPSQESNNNTVSSSNNPNQQYFNNTLHSMKQR